MTGQNENEEADDDENEEADDASFAPSSLFATTSTWSFT